MSAKKKADPRRKPPAAQNLTKNTAKWSDHEKLVALSHPYYPKNEFTLPLEPLVVSAMGTDTVKSEWIEANEHSQSQTPASDKGEKLSLDSIENELLAEVDRFQWMPWSYVMRHVASLIAKGETKALQDFASAQVSYEEGFATLSFKDLARLFSMVACELSRSNARLRKDITKAEIKDLARKLWATNNLRRMGRPQSSQYLQHALDSLPTVDWPLILREIGLHDLRGAKPGRKRKGNTNR
jgi:hypothetical protein